MTEPTEPTDTRAGRTRAAARAAADAARRLDRNPSLVSAVRRLRDHLPGDRNFGDPLSTADRKHFAVLQRQLQELTGSGEGAVRELSGGAIQVWQSFLSARGRDVGEVDVSLLFTDLAGFSSWALTVGDEQTLRLLREVGLAIEPPVT